MEKLEWGVKASFRAYVEGAGGSITLTDGAVRMEDGTYAFSAIPGGNLTIAADGSAEGAQYFEGTVVFEAHGGMLKSTLTELAIEAGQTGLMLTVLEGPTNTGRCAIAELGPVEVRDDGIMVAQTQITMDGMYQIGDHYPPGTELDPITLS